MCGFRYQDKGHTLPETFDVQPKLNGLRCLYNKGIFQSRDEKVWHPGKVAHVIDALATIPDNWVLDGEWYCHGLSLQQINSAMSVNSQLTTEITPTIQFWVFDGFNKSNPLEPFYERFAKIQGLLRNLPQTADQVQLVPTYRCDIPLAEHMFANAKRQHFEGLMYRVRESSYGHAHLCTNADNRWNCLLKRKDFLDANVLVLGVSRGEGKYSEAMGALICEFENGRQFSVGSGFSDAERFRYIDQPPIGSTIRIKYEMLSDEGVPLKPIFESFLD